MRGHSTAQTPVRVAGLEAHTAHCIACGESHMLAVIDSGSLAAWGSNEYGQLGVQAFVLQRQRVQFNGIEVKQAWHRLLLQRLQQCASCHNACKSSPSHPPSAGIGNRHCPAC